MNNIAKLVILTSLVASSLFGGENSITKQGIEAMLSKKGSYEYNLAGRRILRPIDDALLRRLVANPDETREHDFILSTWLLRIAAEGDKNYLYLLDSDELRKGGNPAREEILDILFAYDYNVNGNKKALEALLERVRNEVDPKIQASG